MGKIADAVSCLVIVFAVVISLDMVLDGRINRSIGGASKQIEVLNDDAK
jgi:hypothetical protein